MMGGVESQAAALAMHQQRERNQYGAVAAATAAATGAEQQISSSLLVSLGYRSLLCISVLVRRVASSL